MEVQLKQIIQEKILSSIEAPLPVLTERDVELPSIQGKAITIIGMRRAGKTSFLHQCRANSIQAGELPTQHLYFNFEDERLIGMSATDLHFIPETHSRLFSDLEDKTISLYLDEIQLISGWETFVRRMLDTPGYKVFLSGSSAKLLSREIATSMRGRGWEIIIQPFSFTEYLRHHQYNAQKKFKTLTQKQAIQLDRQLRNYLTEGGFPEAQNLPLNHRRQLLMGYIDILLLRDVIERHKVSNITALRWMMRRLLSAPAGLFSITKLASDLKSQAISVSRETLYEFLDHLEDSFLLHTLPIATDSEKRRQVNPRKVYPADTALIPLFDRSGKANTGHALETAIFLELKRRGAELAYLKTTSGYEVDFLARFPDGSTALIQVCQSIDSSDTLTREVRSLQEAASNHPTAKLLLITLESQIPFPKVPDNIQIIPASQWLLANN